MRIETDEEQPSTMILTGGTMRNNIFNPFSEYHVNLLRRYVKKSKLYYFNSFNNSFRTNESFIYRTAAEFCYRHPYHDCPFGEESECCSSISKCVQQRRELTKDRLETLIVEQKYLNDAEYQTDFNYTVDGSKYKSIGS